MTSKSSTAESVDLINAITAATPSTRVWLRWQNDADLTTTTRGTVTDVDRTAGVCQLEPDRRPDLLQLTLTNSEIEVASVSETAVTRLGVLRAVEFRSRPSDRLRITDAGVVVPDDLVGYTGILTIEDRYGRRYRRIPAPGLEDHDDRLLARIAGRSLAPSYDALEVTVTAGDLHRTYELVDDRTTASTERTTDLDRDPDPALDFEIPCRHTPPRALDADDLEPVLAELGRLVLELSRRSSTDPALECRTRSQLRHHVNALRSTTVTLQQRLFETTVPVDPELEMPSGTGYEPLLDRIDDVVRHLYERRARVPELSADADARLGERLLWCRSQTNAIRRLLCVPSDRSKAPSTAGGVDR
ncbi:hypothetical protein CHINAEXTREME_14295 [Halobiforma lacisalsi AJ5]|uniref:Uncharacterized protein n=1 Tax=Natronobacterium lacisalsi AJ5 TaxID=358396 RepID=M0L477_NATLA|nr:hypothetical protein [Halobiforma lacisalsi]APW98874.1 hypothetical protein CHINAEXTREME_14295 [Halobiforma lacisalsi AJ5]EMA27239.1 hypothetical protein C445_21121 [Halobiforma lacisalsi AJ5]